MDWRPRPPALAARVAASWRRRSSVTPIQAARHGRPSVRRSSGRMSLVAPVPTTGFPSPPYFCSFDGHRRFLDPVSSPRRPPTDRLSKLRTSGDKVSRSTLTGKSRSSRRAMRSGKRTREKPLPWVAVYRALRGDWPREIVAASRQEAIDLSGFTGVAWISTCRGEVSVSRSGRHRRVTSLSRDRVPLEPTLQFPDLVRHCRRTRRFLRSAFRFPRADSRRPPPSCAEC